jgi:hypothetical protein
MNILLSLLVLTILMFSGCVNNSNTSDMNDNNSIYVVNTENDSDLVNEDTIVEDEVEANSEETAETTTQEANSENEITYCSMVTGEVKQEYYFMKDMALMKTTVPPNSWNKVRVNRSLSCAWKI